MNRNQIYLKVISVLVLIALGYMIGGIVFSIKKHRAVNNIVAMRWGDGKYGKSFYGARVFMVPRSIGYSVQARVSIGHSKDYWHDCGEIDQVQTYEEAVKKWGSITWKEDGLYIGGDPSSGGYHLPRSKLESHR